MKKKDTTSNPKELSTQIKAIKLIHSNTSQIYYTDFIYDPLERVSQIINYTKDSITNDSTAIKKIDFGYLNNNSLPTQAMVIENIFGDKRLHVFTYDLDKMLIKDSITSYYYNSQQVTIFNYRYNSNSIIGNYPSLERVDSSFDSTIILNGNIIYSEGYYQLTQFLPPHDTSITTLEYDNKNNPLYLLNVSNIYHTISLGQYPTYFDIAPHLNSSKNNLIKSVEFYDGNEEDINISYSYNSINFPVYALDVKLGDSTRIYFYY